MCVQADMGSVSEDGREKVPVREGLELRGWALFLTPLLFWPV